MKSIKNKLLVYFSVLIGLASIGIGLSAVQVASQALTTESEATLRSIASEGARLTDSVMETERSMVEMIAARADIANMDWEIQRPVLNRLINQTKFTNLGVAQADGTVYFQDGSIAKLGEEDYIKESLSGNSVVSDLIVNEDKALSLMIATPIQSGGKIVGALVGERDGDLLSQIVDDMGFGDEGYAYIINGDGTDIAHPNRDLVKNQNNTFEEVKKDSQLQEVADVFKVVLDERQGISDYRYQGQEFYVGYSPVKTQTGPYL